MNLDCVRAGESCSGDVKSRKKLKSEKGHVSLPCETERLLGDGQH